MLCGATLLCPRNCKCIPVAPPDGPEVGGTVGLPVDGLPVPVGGCEGWVGGVG